MLKAERQQQILAAVGAGRTLTVSDLARQFGVSEITIRRDLDELYESGQVERIRGGVRSPVPEEPEPPVVNRQRENVAEKRAIARAALDLISDGDVIGLQMGTTTLELARALARSSWSDLQVVTNGIPIVNELLRVPGIRLTCIGGVIDSGELACNGVLAEQLLANLNLNRLFIGCRGIDPEQGITNTVQAELEIGTVQAFVRAAREVIVLADHSKFDRIFFMQVLPITVIHRIITDALTPADTLTLLAGKGIEIDVVEVV
jgi:DeoR/GlpR family transcriptional regulator of sugar metabolism